MLFHSANESAIVPVFISGKRSLGRARLARAVAFCTGGQCSGGAGMDPRLPIRRNRLCRGARTCLSSGRQDPELCGGASAYTCLASGLNSDAIGNGLVASVSFNAPAAPSISVSIPNAVGVSATGSSIAISSTGAIFTEIGVSALQCVAAANGDTCTVTLSGAAPTGGALIGLSSADPALSVPASVTIPSGATSASFAAVSAVSAPVTTAQNAPLIASLGSSTVTTTVHVIALVSRCFNF